MLTQAAQGGGGVAVSGGVQEPWRCGTEGYGQWVVLIVGGWLDWVILEFSSNFGDSVILFHDSMHPGCGS